MVVVIIGLFLTPAGLIAFFTGFSDWIEAKRFLKKSVETEGTIIGLIGAKHSYNMIGGGAASQAAAMQMASGQSAGKGTSRDAGAFLRVEYEVGDYVYTIRSRQNFNEIPENNTVKVQYDPHKPKEAIVEGFYSGAEKTYQMAGGLFMASIPLLYYLFS